MRMIAILTAAAFGLMAWHGIANAQATNMAPKSGQAKTLSSSTEKGTVGKASKKMKKSSKKSKKM